MNTKDSHWKAVPLGDVQRVIVLVHGLGEHSRRYQSMVEWLTMNESAVLAHDHYGHGRAKGARGTLQSQTQLREAVLARIAAARREFPALPCYVLGHSLGGLIALDVALSDADVNGVIALSPALALRMRSWQRVLSSGLMRLTPNMTLANGLPVDGISRDPAVVAAYRDDPLVHDRISMQLLNYLLDAAQRVQDAAETWSVPTLLLYAGDDKLVDPQGSADFAAKAPKEVVSAYCFNDAYHELHHEPDSEDVFARIKSWVLTQSKRRYR